MEEKTDKEFVPSATISSYLRFKCNLKTNPVLYSEIMEKIRKNPDIGTKTVKEAFGSTAVRQFRFTDVISFVEKELRAAEQIIEKTA